jgi:hypothetical protein
MFTPFATELWLLVTTFTPVAPLRELPARLVVDDCVDVTVEPAVATDVSVWPAVRSPIWLSVMACDFVCLLFAE